MSFSQERDKRITAYSNFIIRWRWAIILFSLVAAVFITSGGRFLGFNNDYRVFFSEDNPHLQAFDAQQRTYTKNDNIIFAITPKNGQVFDREVLSAVEEMTREAWLLPYALRVDSVSNFQYSRADGDDLIVTDLVENASSLSDEDLAHLKQVALSEPFLVGQLLNEETSVTGINVTFHMPEVDLNETPETVAAARALAEKIAENIPSKCTRRVL